MMDETYLVEHIKDELCFVSQDVRADLATARQPGLKSPHRREYLLPDGVTSTWGRVRTAEEVAQRVALGQPKAQQTEQVGGGLT